MYCVIYELLKPSGNVPELTPLLAEPNGAPLHIPRSLATEEAVGGFPFSTYKLPGMTNLLSRSSFVIEVLLNGYGYVVLLKNALLYAYDDIMANGCPRLYCWVKL